MGRQSEAMTNIMTIYSITAHERDEIIKRSKTVLKIVRGVYWATKNKAENRKSEVAGRLSLDLDACLLYLSDLAPLKERQDFEANVLDLFKNRWMLQPLEQALENVKSYPETGERYHEILYRSYFDTEHLSQERIIAAMSMDSSHYYSRKKEAILLFGLCFMSIVTPTLKQQKARRQRKNKGNTHQDTPHVFPTIARQHPHHCPTHSAQTAHNDASDNPLP